LLEYITKNKNLIHVFDFHGWEQVTKQNPAKDAFNLEETRDFMPQMGPMAGYAVTLVIEPSNPQHRISNPKAKSSKLKAES